MQALTKITSTEGVIGACGGQRGALTFSFRHASAMSDGERRRWQDLVQGAVALTERAQGHDEIRVVLSEHTILIRRDDDHFAGAIVIKGHPVVKSLQRMVRRVLRLVRPQPQRIPDTGRPADLLSTTEPAAEPDSSPPTRLPTGSSF